MDECCSVVTGEWMQRPFTGLKPSEAPRNWCQEPRPRHERTFVRHRLQFCCDALGVAQTQHSCPTNCGHALITATPCCPLLSIQVGDPDQAIYSWRGADAKNMDSRMEEDFPGLHTCHLRCNYRQVHTASYVPWGEGLFESS